MRVFALIGVIASVVASTPATATTLIGQTANAVYQFPTFGTVYNFATTSPPNFVIGDGVEAVIDVEGVTFISVDFAASSLRLTLDTTLGAPTWELQPFNGPVFTLLSGGAFPAIASVTASNSFAVLSSVSGDTLSVSWPGMSYSDGDTVDIAFVPLPGAAALFAGALGLLAAVARRRAA